IYNLDHLSVSLLQHLTTELSFDYSFFFFQFYCHHPDLHSFPTRRSSDLQTRRKQDDRHVAIGVGAYVFRIDILEGHAQVKGLHRSEEHTSELQLWLHLVCRLLLEKKRRYTIDFISL